MVTNTPWRRTLYMRTTAVPSVQRRYAQTIVPVFAMISREWGECEI